MTHPNTAYHSTAHPFVLIDNSQVADGHPYLFKNPRKIIRCDSPEQVPSALAQIEAACDDGLYAAGFFAYELGYVLEPRLQSLLPRQRTQPLLWIGLFDQCHTTPHNLTAHWLAHQTSGVAYVSPMQPSMSQNAYCEAFEQIQRYISAGDLYQVNLTFKQLMQVTGDPIDLYQRLRTHQPVAHGGLIRGDDFHILSLSPELFIDINDGHMIMRPMKGTAARGSTDTEDMSQRKYLHADTKNRAENLMIVDLMRNDMGRIARTGSVHVPDLFTVETYPTLHQMTSTLHGHLRNDIALAELLRGLFPCGSITGAPKIRAMEIIHELEDTPRGVYTGSMGFIGPDQHIRFNVAIRTLHIDATGRGEMGVGSGVVADSDGLDEYHECLLKARFLEDAIAQSQASSATPS